MLFRVHSAAVFGIKAYPIAVEVDLSSGQKLNLMTVGLPDTAVRESSERVKAALRNCGYILPPQRITINLAPADVKKDRPSICLWQLAYWARRDASGPRILRDFSSWVSYRWTDRCAPSKEPSRWP